MLHRRKIAIWICCAFFICNLTPSLNAEPISVGSRPVLPEPDTSLVPTVNIAKASQWPEGKSPKVMAGFTINAFASQLNHPRWLYVLPNGDVLVAQSNYRSKKKAKLKDWIAAFFMNKAGAGIASPDKIVLLRDSDGDGKADIVSDFLTHLNAPIGMALIGRHLYVANTDALVRFEYETGALSIDQNLHPAELITDLPAQDPNSHWTKNILASADGKKIYVAVGSNSNIAEHGMQLEQDRAAILEVDLASKQKRIFASGLRNPVGLAWNPSTQQLWCAVNERDELGDDLVPDYISSVNDGDFFGWPWIYYEKHRDPRVKTPMPAGLNLRAPDYALGAHVAALGLVFNDKSNLPTAFRNGALVSQHGSWNRSVRSGYKVVFVPFEHGKPNGLPSDFVWGFVEQNEAYGRPVGLAFDIQGNVLIADDVGNRVWRVSPQSSRVGQ